MIVDELKEVGDKTAKEMGLGVEECDERCLLPSPAMLGMALSMSSKALAVMVRKLLEGEKLERTEIGAMEEMSNMLEKLGTEMILMDMEMQKEEQCPKE